MPSTYYTYEGKIVYNGDVARAEDLNTINTSVDSAFELVKVDVDALTGNAEYYADLSQKWAENPFGVEVEPGSYSSLHWATSSMDSAEAAAISESNASTSESNASTSESNANASAISAAADAAQTALDVIQTGADVSTTTALVASIDTPTILRKTADTGAAILPVGTTAQRPGSPATGNFRYNSSLTSFEGYLGGAWYVMYARNNIIGTVSQSAGVPTGAIIERGSNANGDYTRFADGTMICWNTVTYDPDLVALGSIYGSSGLTVWTYPSTFSVRPVISGNDTASTNIWFEYNAATVSTNLRAFSYTSAITGTRFTDIVAIGRWF